MCKRFPGAIGRKGMACYHLEQSSIGEPVRVGGAPRFHNRVISGRIEGSTFSIDAGTPNEVYIRGRE